MYNINQVNDVKREVEFKKQGQTRRASPQMGWCILVDEGCAVPPSRSDELYIVCYC